MITELDVCRRCGNVVRELDHEPGVLDDTVYYCDRCENWIEGLPETREFQITDITRLL